MSLYRTPPPPPSLGLPFWHRTDVNAVNVNSPVHYRTHMET